jgi:hypothetical protein
MSRRVAREKKQVILEYCGPFKRLLLKLVDCRSKRGFDGKSSAAQFEGNGGMLWT